MYFSNNQVLDFALNYLHQISGINNKFIPQSELAENMNGVDVKDIHAICNKLYKDGFILFSSNSPVDINDSSVKLSFDGKTFQESGGYQERERRTQIEIEEIKTNTRLRIRNDERLVKWTRNLFWGTILVGIGAVGLVIWEIWHFYHGS